MSNTLISIWNELISIGYNIRKNKLNGLTEWQPYKSTYQSKIIEDCKFLKIRREFTEFTKSLNYSYSDEEHIDALLIVNNSSVDNKVEKDHFIIQHFRLPMLMNYNMNVVKIAQMAYNIGQAKFEMENENYSNDIMDFYKMHKLDNFYTYFEHNLKVI